MTMPKVSSNQIPAHPNTRLISMRDVVAMTTYSRPSIYRLIDQGIFPKPVKLGAVKIAFLADEVEAWLASRPRALGEPIL